ncbi:hypothetical protein QF035_000186 [Streptomyces umbrinus]|uniref:Uncharacterized protein n=1 Tax=Streptomyces umbrinus TaxID=67370 RepID=A0ABU0SGC7_9ACTN|nr:hypothetical protein [Streptomyces umbrinus]MDQ1022604.1 hypothetical protein [Streptomyces umbrinus]
MTRGSRPYNLFLPDQRADDWTCGYFTSKGERPWRPISGDWLEYVEEDPESGAMSWDIEATDLRRRFGRRLQRAVREANSARFEYGETPGR